MNEAAGPLKDSIKIDGKRQIIEMLQFMSNEERDKLLKNISKRNPTMATELMEKSLKFDNIESLADQDLIRLSSYVSPVILGLAIKNSTHEFQRKLLSLVDRRIAEQAFQYMNTNTGNIVRDVARAQQKVLDMAIKLNKRRLISLT